MQYNASRYSFVCAMVTRRATPEWIMSRIEESCHTRRSHVTLEYIMSLTNESCNKWMSHVSQEDFIQHVHPFVTCVSHICVRVSHICVCVSRICVTHMWRTRNATKEIYEKSMLCVSCEIGSDRYVMSWEIDVYLIGDEWWDRYVMVVR